ncbi:hypothetical protein GO491_09715 [Flavobacteriaceae bacterium Ap0902]|nr:hypothetical protein [Flavobacteriaceae bacterium Ap0902]
MKKVILVCAMTAAIISCKNEDKKPPVIGTNENGEELVVNETGDTVVYTPPVKEDNVELDEEEKEDVAFEKDADGSFHFKFNLEKGEKYPFKIVTNATNVQSNGKESATLTQESTTELEYQVKDITEEGFVMDVQYKRFAEKMSDGTTSVSFDTNGAEPKEDAAKQRWKFNKAIIGNSFNMTIDEHGKVQDISNLFKVRDKVKTEMKSDLEPEQLNMLDEFLNAALSDEAMKQMFEESLAYYPKKPVKKGDTWSINNSEGNAKSDINYTFDGINNGVATIKISGTSSGSDSQTDPNGSGVKIFRSLEGKVNGTAHVDQKTGWVKNAVMNKEETMRMTQQLNDQKINLSSTSKSTTKIN